MSSPQAEKKIVRRFAVGDLKGRPLESAGLPYQIIKHRGLDGKLRDVAQFRNGAMAYFIEEEISIEPIREIPLVNPEPQIIVENAARELYPNSFMLVFEDDVQEKKTPWTFHMTKKSSIRLCNQLDVFDILPALAVCLFSDGFSIELSWLNAVISFEYDSQLKPRPGHGENNRQARS